MRLKSEIWVKAFVRQCSVAGRWAVVARRGDPDAGTIYVQVDRLDGTVRLFGPAPGSAFDDDGERRWAEVSPSEPMTAADARAWLDRRIAFDPDIWIVDLESRDGTCPLERIVAE